MIARVWRGETRAEAGDAYAAYLERTGAAECRGTPGNRGVQVLRRVVGDRAQFVFISFWESWDAIRTLVLARYGSQFRPVSYVGSLRRAPRPYSQGRPT